MVTVLLLVMDKTRLF